MKFHMPAYGVPNPGPVGGPVATAGTHSMAPRSEFRPPGAKTLQINQHLVIWEPTLWLRSRNFGLQGPKHPKSINIWSFEPMV